MSSHYRKMKHAHTIEFDETNLLAVIMTVVSLPVIYYWLYSFIYH